MGPPTPPPAAAAAPACTPVAVLAVIVHDRRAVAEVTVDGARLRMMVDSGSTTTLIDPAEADRLHLEPLPTPPGSVFTSNGRPLALHLARAAHVIVAGLERRDLPIMLAALEEPGIEGALGQDALGDADVEYDLAHGAVRLFAPGACGPTGPTAAWGAPAVRVTLAQDALPRSAATLEIDGARLTVMFDTGTPATEITEEAAARAGVPDGGPLPSRAALAGSAFAVRAARLRDVRLGAVRFSDLTAERIDKPHARFDMLLGADFFLAHRVWVARSQGVLAFAPATAVGETWTGAR